MDSVLAHLIALGVAFGVGWLVTSWWTRSRDYKERIAERLDQQPYS